MPLADRPVSESRRRGEVAGAVRETTGAFWQSCDLRGWCSIQTVRQARTGRLIGESVTHSETGMPR